MKSCRADSKELHTLGQFSISNPIHKLDYHYANLPQPGIWTVNEPGTQVYIRRGLKEQKGELSGEATCLRPHTSAAVAPYSK